MLHTVFVSYNRLELLKETVFSYLDTVTVPHTFTVVDNKSDDETQRWLHNSGFSYHLLSKNRYPGFACNLGWEGAPKDATLLHRSDNDMRYLPGWCDEVLERFQDPTLGQLGLRTLEEEGNHPNVGGSCVIRRELWDKGLRYDERPWSELPFEDGLMSYRVRKLGFAVVRAQQPCVEHIGIASSEDPYYQQTFADRRITFAEWGVA